MFLDILSCRYLFLRFLAADYFDTGDCAAAVSFLLPLIIVLSAARGARDAALYASAACAHERRYGARLTLFRLLLFDLQDDMR